MCKNNFHAHSTSITFLYYSRGLKKFLGKINRMNNIKSFINLKLKLKDALSLQ